MIRKLAPIILLSGTALLVGCKSTAPKNLPPVAVHTPHSNQIPTPPAEPIGPQPGSQQHFEETIGGRHVIYFDTSSHSVDTLDADALKAQAQYLSAYPNLTITLEGHCDERGTREYNLALGERRANAAKNYLTGLGIQPQRIRTISYGKERPAAMGSTEIAWAQNRRAVSVIIN